MGLIGNIRGMFNHEGAGHVVHIGTVVACHIHHHRGSRQEGCTVGTQGQQWRDTFSPQRIIIG